MPIEKKILHVNADDFGYCPSVNRAIAIGHKKGFFSSASILANGAAFQEACVMSLKERIPVGIHLNLTEGRPVSRPTNVSSLLNKCGTFWGKWRFSFKLSLGLINPDHVKREIAAQLERVMEFGIKPIHLDSHHNIHVLPAINQVCTQIARKYCIENIRVIQTPIILGPRHMRATCEQLVIAYLNKSNLEVPHKGRYAYWGFELFHSKNKNRCVARILQRLVKGENFLVCHPAVKSYPNNSFFDRRADEFEAFSKIDWLSESHIGIEIKKVLESSGSSIAGHA